MSQSANTLDTLNGLFKQVYGTEVKDLIPDGAKLVKRVPFAAKDQRIGKAYNQPVVLGHEHGVTFAASGEDVFNLNAPVSGRIEEAQIVGTQLVLRSAIGYATASRSMSGGQAAFQEATKFLVGNMLRSVTKKLEIEMLYGQVGYGEVASITGNTITITTAEWAPGIWAGSERMPIEIRSADGLTSRGETEITAVSFDNRTITVQTLPAGTTATDVIWHKGAYGKEFAGVHKIITNTGTLFGIDSSEYALWKGNTYDASNAALSFQKLQDAIARAVEKGLDNDVMVMVNPKTWADLLNDQAALRQYDGSYSPASADNGAREIKFYGQNGVIEIIPSIYVKEGYAYILDESCFMRIGSTEVTFKRPGKGDEFFRELDNSAGYELRCYADMALFCHSPGRNVLIENITN